MALNKHQLESEFFCPKCRGRGAVVQEVTVGRSVANLLPLSANTYLAATCGLCGYTEFYNTAVAEKAAQPARELRTPAKLAEKPET